MTGKPTVILKGPLLQFIVQENDNDSNELGISNILEDTHDRLYHTTENILPSSIAYN